MTQTLLSPYDLPRLRFLETVSEVEDQTKLESRDVPWSYFLAEPVDPGQWTMACLSRTYVMSTCPTSYLEEQLGTELVDHASYSRNTGFQISWRTPPKTDAGLRRLRAGWGHPVPDYIVLTDLKDTPLDTFRFIRSLGLDEIVGYLCMDWNKLDDLLTIFQVENHFPGLIAPTEKANTFLKSKGLVEKFPYRKLEPDPLSGKITPTTPLLIARLEGRPFQCPEALKTFLGSFDKVQETPQQVDDVEAIARWIEKFGSTYLPLVNGIRAGVWRG